MIDTFLIKLTQFEQIGLLDKIYIPLGNLKIQASHFCCSIMEFALETNKKPIIKPRISIFEPEKIQDLNFKSKKSPRPMLPRSSTLESWVFINSLKQDIQQIVGKVSINASQHKKY